MSLNIYIDQISSLSPLGANTKTILSSYKESSFKTHKVGNHKVFPLHKEAEDVLNDFLSKHPQYNRVDRSTQLALAASSRIQGPSDTSNNWVINAASSRGATGIWEQSFHKFIETGNVPVKTSPLTTLGNIASNVGQHLKVQGGTIDHSITCGSGLQAIANGIAWLQSEQCDHFLAIAAEAPLTDFTVSQMSALGIYSSGSLDYPCSPCIESKSPINTFVLGEAAMAISLSKTAKNKQSLRITGMGMGVETIASPSAISANGIAFQHSMSQALKKANLGPENIDIIIPHSPGTHHGDQAEKKAITSIFDVNVVKVINGKFLTGHTLATSGLLGVELGILMLKNDLELDFPYPSLYPKVKVKEPKAVMINAMGFGGNAISLIVQK